MMSDVRTLREIIIIGGGVIGLAIARELRKGGAGRIAIVERGICGSEASWAAAGMIAPQVEADEDGTFFEFCRRSRDLFPALADELLDETGIDIELDRAGTLFVAFTEDGVEHLRRRFEWQKRAGLPIEFLPGNEARRAEPFASPDIRGALHFPDDWQVDNRKLLTALRRYAELNDIAIIESTEVESLLVENGKVIGVQADPCPINAEWTILATGAWTSGIKLGLADVPFRVEPVRGQIVTFHTAKRLYKHVIYSRRGYIVPRADGRILAGSTAEIAGFDKGVTDEAAVSLRQVAIEIAPSIANLQITDQWSGLRPFAADGLPVLGSLAGIDGLKIATAHYRNGILLAPLTARIVADNLLSGADHHAFTAFSPDRFRFASGSRTI